MEEINIERKNNRPVWPWIIGLLVLALVIWGVFEAATDKDRVKDVTAVQNETSNDMGTQERPAIESGSGISGGMSAVNDFSNYIKQDHQSMDMHHEYTSTGLTKLADAIESISMENNIKNENLNKEIESIKTKAASLQEDATSTKHADKIKGAFTSAAQAISQIQEEKFPALNKEVEDLKKQAQKVEKNKPALEQETEIKEFFDQSASLLQRLAVNLPRREDVTK